MKKIFGIVLLSLIALTACDNGDDAATVCTTLEMVSGGTTLTIYAEDGYVTEYFLESSLYVGDLSEEEIENAQRLCRRAIA